MDSSEDDYLNLGDYEIQEKVYKTNYWKFYKVGNITNKSHYYLAKSSLRVINDIVGDQFSRGDVINFFRGIDNNYRVNYPTILKIIGYSLTNFKNDQKPVILYEGTSTLPLKHLLSQNKETSNISGWNDTKKLINIYGIASGMSYLHSNNIIYRNLDTENIFLDKNFYPKITNFEFSIELPKNGFIEEHTIKGKTQYQSPEVLTNLTYSKASDVYAFSLIMYSILTNNEPFQNLKGSMDVIWKKDYRPSFEAPIDECYKKLIQRCWSKNPNERPTFCEILNELKNNPEFVTETVNREEFEEYIKFIEDSPKSFDQNVKKRKLDEVLLIKKNKLAFDYRFSIEPKIEFKMNELTNIEENDSNNEYKKYDAFKYFDNDKFNFKRLCVEIYRKEINFFFRHEIYNLYQKLNVLSKISHPAILRFYGFSPFDFKNKQKPTIFYETYFGNNCRVANDTFRKIDKIASTYDLIVIYGIASAMSYLHSHNIIHRNLTTLSIFNANKRMPKLGGFDLSIDLTNYHQEKDDKIKGVPSHLAPEIYTNKEYSKASDVYSFAMVLYEIITYQKPFNDCLNPNEIKEKVVNLKQRPAFDVPINQTYRRLIERCWSHEPKERPTFDEILQELRTNPGFISEEMDEDYYRKYIQFLDDTPFVFQPEKKITYLDKIFNNQLHTFQEIGPCTCLDSMYETETNDLSFKYDNFNLMNFKRSKSVDNFFYSIEKIENKETNEIYMNKFTAEIDNFTKSDIINFSSEMKIISQLNHPSILKFIGYSVQQVNRTHFRYNVIVEYSPNEPLNKIIENNYSYLDDTKKLITIYGIASAMSYLHSHGILHRDLKPANIYFDEINHPKLSGFNISIETGHYLIEKCDKIKGTPAYLAPEVYLKNEYSSASDVYSFSLIMYEIITAKKPFDKKLSPKQIKEKLNKMERPLFDEQINKSYRSLIERCWSQNPKERPTFDEIVNELKSNREFLLNSVNEEEYKNYISFIDESPKTFDTSKRITRFDVTIKNRIDDFHELDNKINFRNIYETEYDEVLFNYDFLELDNYELHDRITYIEGLEYFNAVDKRTGKKCQACIFTFYFTKSKYWDSRNRAYCKINNSIELNHPSILKFIGYSPYNFENEDIPIFITEYTLPSFDLSTFINESSFDDVFDTKRLIILYGIASGMSYLHSNNIIHRSLNMISISFDERLFPKITELYTSIKMSEEPIIRGFDDESEYDFFAPPERLKNNLICPASNVYSFGMIAYILLEKREPFCDCKDYFEIIQQIETNDLRPEFKEEDPKCFTKLIEKCWATDPSQRPTFDEISYYLKTNPEFITEKVDKTEFLNYIDFIDKCKSNKTYVQIDDYIKSNNCAFRKVNYDYKKIVDSKKVHFSIDMGSIEISDYTKLEKIGEGNFGDVYNVIEKKTNKNYAAKISKSSIDDITDNVDTYNDFIINLTREIEIISQLNHHSILQFAGYSPVNFDKSMKNPVIITELVTKGSLGSMINNERLGLAPHEWDDTKKLINIYGIAAGMKYIHNLNILHRDLKPDNILLDEFLYPRICDFGLSKFIDPFIGFFNESKLKNKSQLKGSPAYISPEIFQNHQYSRAGDVYAFGLIVYEIITNNDIFDETFLSIYHVGLKVVNGYRPKFNFQIPYVYKKLITKCWNEDPKERPSFDKICKSLENDKRFITENVDENEFLDYVSFTQEKLNEAMFKQPKKVIFEAKTYDEEEKVENDKLEDFFLDLSNFEIQSTITKRNDSKLLILKEKQTNFYYQGQFSLTKIDSIFSSENLNVLSKEIKVISQIKHPLLLKFIGYSPIDFENQRKPVIVTELPSNGSLAKLLEISRMKNNEVEGWDATRKLINIYGIASCLSYLHSHGILHCSLNPSNVFLDEILTPKIGDYGLSNLFSNLNKQIHHQSMIRVKNDSIYSAPEVLIKNEYTTKSDVYSFGMIIYEILSNEIPFNEISNENQLISLIVQNEKRPNINEKVPNKYKELIVKCWSQNPDERPSFDQIVHQLKFDNDFITDNINVDDFNRFKDFIEEQLNSEFSQKIIENESVINEEEKIEIKEDEIFEKDNILNESKEEDNSTIFNLNKYHEFESIPVKSFESEQEDLLFRIQDQNNDNESIDQQILLAKRYIEENDTENIYKYFCIMVKKGSCMVPLNYSISLYKKKFYKQAFKYFTILSTVNHPIALFFIGVMKYRGEGCQKDEEEAYRILKHLSRNGIERATDFLNEYFEK